MRKSEINLLSDAGTAKLAEMSDDNAVYTDYLKFQGRVFKQKSDVAMEFFAQMPGTQYIATAEQWKSAGYRVKNGGRAIHFTDEDGNGTNLFDFSQVIGSNPPKIWEINFENAGEIKAELGIAKNKSIIGAVVEQTVNNSRVTDCMESLEIPPHDFEKFQKSFYVAVQTIIAGRLEIGGSKFNITPDMTAFNELSETGKMGFLTLVADTARKSLLHIEKAATKINAKNFNRRNEENELSRMAKPHSGGTRQDFSDGGRQTSDNPTGGIAERPNHVENDSERRGREPSARAVLGSADTGRNTDGNLSGVQTDERVGADDVVQAEPVLGDIRDESDGHGTVDDGRTNWDLRVGMAGLHERTSPTLGGTNAVETQTFDSSESGGREGMGVSVSSRPTVRTGEPPTERVRGHSGVGNNEDVLHGRGSDEDDGADSRDTTLTDTAKEKINNLFADETSVNKADVFSLSEKANSRSRGKIDPNQGTLFDLLDGGEVAENTPIRTAPTPINQAVIDNILSHGGNDRDSLLRIIAQFQKGKNVSENADFLREEFTGRIAGDVIGRGHVVDNHKYAVWFDSEDGIKISRGESAKTPQLVLPWNTVAERISELLQQGTFATQENLDQAWDYEIQLRANNTWDINRDCGDGHEFFPFEWEGRGGYPADTAKVAEFLREPESLQKIIDSMSDFTDKYAQNRDIMRFHWYNPTKTLANLRDLQLTPIRFEADPTFGLHSQLFITEDEKNQLVASGHHAHRTDEIAKFFRSNNVATSSEAEKFLKSHYATHSGSHRSGYSSECSSQGLTLKRAYQTKFGHDIYAYDEYDKSLMGWNDVAKRISAAVRAGEYVAEEREKTVPEVAERLENVQNEQNTAESNITESVEITPDTPTADFPAVYMQSIQYATEHNERDICNESNKLNLDCAKAINRVLVNMEDVNLENMEKAVAEVTAQYGLERTTAVVAGTFKFYEADKRIHISFKRWANDVETPRRFYHERR